MKAQGDSKPVSKEQGADPRHKLALTLALLPMTRPFRSLLVVQGVDLQLLLITFIVLILFLHTIGRLPRLFWFLTRDKLLLFLIALVPLSLFWSAVPMRSFVGVLNFSAGTFVGIYLAMHFSLREQLQIVGWALAIAAVASLIVGIISPALGRMYTGEGALVWNGVFEHKNSLGRYMAIFAVAAWSLTLQEKRYGVWGLFLLLALLLIILAQSATPLLALFVMACMLPLFGVFRWRDVGIRLMSLILLLLGIGIAAVFLWHPSLGEFSQYGLALLGRDPDRNTVLVRLGLWNYSWEYIKQQPLLGYGFDAFWSLPGRRDFITYLGRAWEAQQAHNGFIELWLQLGLVGLGGMVLHLLVNARRILQAAPLLTAATFSWALGYMIVLAVLNTSYSALLGQLTVPWSLYVAITLSICAHLERHRAAARIAAA